MFGPKELDMKNTYNPNLQDIQESAERTYGEANAFYEKEELYLKYIGKKIMMGELASPKEIYDKSHAIASDLAKCCEMYLKALYIFEHNIPGNQIDSLWETLKNSEFKTDQMGNLLYMLPNGIVTFVKYRSNGEPFKDTNGKVMYFDNNGNIYNENNRGSRIKRSGHQLDRLIELLSPESRLLLETRMLTIPMDLTEKNKSVSVLDVLQKNGILDAEQKITTEQYAGWIEQHKKTFEEARYSGQKSSNVNVEFLYHLATQLKAVAQFKIDPKNNQKFTITEDEMSKLPVEIKQLASSHPKLISEELIKLIASDDKIKDKVINILSNSRILSSRSISPFTFCKMMRLMSNEEISYTLKLCYILDNFDKDDIHNNDESISRIVIMLKSIGITSDKTIEYLVQLKEMLGDNIKIENAGIRKILDALSKKYNDYIYYINKKTKKFDTNPKINNDIYYNDYIIHKY